LTKILTEEQNEYREEQTCIDYIFIIKQEIGEGRERGDHRRAELNLNIHTASHEYKK
jgi:hypothetical protein